MECFYTIVADRMPLNSMPFMLESLMHQLPVKPALKTKKSPDLVGMHKISFSQNNTGLTLDDSILSFDDHDSSQLTFLSSASSVTSKKSTSQVIATEETIRLLECSSQRPDNVLSCQYNRPFSVGKLKIELLPSGSMLGAASLYIENQNGKVLYAPSLQPSKIPTIRSMQLKAADTLVLGCHHSEPSASSPSRKKEKDRLVHMAKEYIKEGKTPIILCNALSTAPEITKHFSDHGMPLRIHQSIYKVNKIHESFGSALGDYSIFSRKHYHRIKPVLFPEFNSKINRLKKPLPTGSIFSVKDDTSIMSETGEALRFVDEKFILPSLGDGYDLKDIISAVKPGTIYLYGPYIKRYLDILENVHPNIIPLFPNNQPLLF